MEIKDIELKQNYVLVEPISMKSKVVGSILVVEDIQDKKVQRGTVLAIGDGILPDGKVAPLNVTLGETVLYAFNTGHITKMNHKDYVILREEEILAVLEA